MYNSFDCELSFIDGVYVTVEVTNGVATLPRADYHKMTPKEQETLVRYVKYHCERANIPLTRLAFIEEAEPFDGLS